MISLWNCHNKPLFVVNNFTPKCLASLSAAAWISTPCTQLDSNVVAHAICTLLLQAFHHIFSSGVFFPDISPLLLRANVIVCCLNISLLLLKSDMVCLVMPYWSPMHATGTLVYILNRQANMILWQYKTEIYDTCDVMSLQLRNSTMTA